MLCRAMVSRASSRTETGIFFQYACVRKSSSSISPAGAAQGVIKNDSPSFSPEMISACDDGVYDDGACDDGAVEIR